MFIVLLLMTAGAVAGSVILASFTHTFFFKAKK